MISCSLFLILGYARYILFHISWRLVQLIYSVCIYVKKKYCRYLQKIFKAGFTHKLLKHSLSGQNFFICIIIYKFDVSLREREKLFCANNSVRVNLILNFFRKISEKVATSYEIYTSDMPHCLAFVLKIQYGKIKP